MKSTAYSLVVLIPVLFAVLAAPKTCAQSTTTREYKVKAAFLYNFIKFVDWPQEKLADNNEPITIGIIGKDPFGGAFEPLKEEQAKSRKVIIKRFEGFNELRKKDKPQLQSEIEALRKCHLLFICSSEKENLKEIIDLTKDHGILTVGDMDGFLESGGIVNFIIEEEKGEKKVRFEISLAAAQRGKLQIRSQITRLAKRVIK